MECNIYYNAILISFQADLGPDKYLSDKDLQYAVKLLSSCSVSTA